ncbi:glycosyltransferase family A protein [Pseudomonas sp.]|uniref:glycosyltransferase family 2 protein n=1 Tax=Pseudomonas sp. TaxID=306 RepID=UPI0028A9B1BB|nr:glycosyltransferase family A protein [Pseudomonas sp.]
MSGPAVPLVSVLVPCYNYANFVGEALTSVLDQDYPNFELIVVDDGSTDDSASVIERTIEALKLGSRAHRVLFLKQENQGVSAALNTALALAEGEFVATFDADDIMPQGRLAVQAAYMSEHPEVGCLGGVAIRIDEQGALLPKKDKKREIRRYDFDRALSEALVVGGNIAVYRRDAMMAAGGYDPAIRVQDFQMTLKIAHEGYFVDILPEIVTLYRKHPDSLSKQYKSEYLYGLKVIHPYIGHAAYSSCKSKLVSKALRLAVLDDKKYAWRLIVKVPFVHWDRQLLKRLRYLIFR